MKPYLQNRCLCSDCFQYSEKTVFIWTTCTYAGLADETHDGEGKFDNILPSYYALRRAGREINDVCPRTSDPPERVSVKKTSTR